MSWRSIVSRGAALALAALWLPSCGGGPEVRPGDPFTGEILKISYYRVNPEPKTKRPEPTFRAVMSDAWRETLGESPRDLLTKAAPNKVFKGFAAHTVMARYIRELRNLGLDRLESQNADGWDPAQVYQRAVTPLDKDHPRIITVATDKVARSYSFHGQRTEELTRTFIACEKLVSAIMDGHTIMVKIENPRAVVPDR